MPNELEIVEIGDPFINLRQVSTPIEDVHDPELGILIEDMLETCRVAQGVGISAVQVGRPIRLCIIASRPTSAYPDAAVIDPIVMFNPKFETVTDEEEVGWEGCLSVPGILAKIFRAEQIKAIYTDSAGISRERVLKGFLARIFQHELDHLNGTLFIDHCNPENLVTDKSYQKILALRP